MQSPQRKKRFSTKISNKIIENKEAVNRLLVNGKSSCFISLKEHQPNFLNNTKVPKLNPPKYYPYRISKSILDKINTSPRNLIKVSQRKHTSEVI